MSQEFLKAAEEVKGLSYMPSNDAKLELYGLYKQVTDGDCKTTKPSFVYYVDQKKWYAWNKLKGMSKKDAEAKYIAFVESLKSKE